MKGWSPLPESPLFLALLKYLGSDCTTTGNGKASFVFKSEEEVVRVTVEVVRSGQHSWEFIDTAGEPILHLHGYSPSPVTG